MNRRAFLAAVPLLAATRALAQGRPARIGFLGAASADLIPRADRVIE